MYDVIIIGAGPAGISSALYTVRANLKVLVLYKGTSNVERAVKIDNYYGFAKGVSGEELYKNGILQAKNLGADVLQKEVISIEKNDDSFTVNTEDEAYMAKVVIISTGNKKMAPDIENLQKFEGKGVSYCAVCDGFFYKNKKVAVIGNGNFAISEAEFLRGIAEDVILFTDGQDFDKKDVGFDVITNKIKMIDGDNHVEGIIVDNGARIEIDGIFVAIGEADATDFARTIGIITENGDIKVNENMETNVKGLLACGNVTGGLLQISKAVYEGTKAGLSAIKYIKGEM